VSVTAVPELYEDEHVLPHSMLPVFEMIVPPAEGESCTVST